MAFLRGYRRDALGALLALMLVSGANLLSPLFIRLAIDEGLAKEDSAAVAWAVAGLVGVAIVRGIFSFLQGFLAERASQGVAYDLRNAVFAHIQRLSFAYYDKVETGQLLTRLTSDVEQVRGFVGTGVVQIAGALIMLVGTAILLLILNWQLALISLATIPLLLALLLRFVRKIGPLFGRVQMALGRLNSILQEDLTGVRVIRAFVREDFESARYGNVNDELLGHNVAAIRAFSGNFPLVFLLANLGTVAVVWFGGLEVIDGDLTIGELIAFNAYLGFLLFPILTIGFQAAGLSRAGASALRVFEVLDEPLTVTDRPGAIELPSVAGRVEFRDVHFRYPGAETETLRGVDFAVEPGQTVALLGATGSGKSTIVSLLPRFYDVTGGAVLIDGHDVRNVTVASLRRQIAMVRQETLLFSGTVRENIAYGRPDASLDEVEAAARAAQAHDFISVLPKGYETVVGERGIGLSGGQRQRIAIARALLVDRCLLILDDSTSAIDAATEAAIQDALDALMRSSRRTAFVIAHRLSTVRDADLIVVLDQGQVAAIGTHEELRLTSRLYEEILGSQLFEAGGERQEVSGELGPSVDGRVRASVIAGRDGA
jgi:ATP-binding cassette subfamily B protein